MRDLFAVYKTRIWMEQVHASSNFTPSGAVAVALQTGEKECQLTILLHSSLILTILSISIETSHPFRSPSFKPASTPASME